MSGFAPNDVKHAYAVAEAAVRAAERTGADPAAALARLAVLRAAIHAEQRRSYIAARPATS